MSRTTKSATEFAKTTYDAARRVFPEFSGRFSPKKFTQPQIVTMLALRQFFKLDYRGTTERLREWKELREVIEIGERVPHFTTLIHAEKRLLKKEAIARLFDVSVERARAAGLLRHDPRDDKTKLAGCDSTGMEARHVSTYFGKRSKRKYRRFPKFWAVVAAASHVCLGMVPGTGPTPDDPQFHRVAQQAHEREPFRALAADCGFDGEEHQQFLDEKLKVIGIIPPERGRPRTRSDPDRRGGFFRQFIHEHWPRELYGQRWQVETFFSMLKRLLDSFLRATTWRSQHREMCLKCLTLNFMLIAGATTR